MALALSIKMLNIGIVLLFMLPISVLISISNVRKNVISPALTEVIVTFSILIFQIDLASV